MHVVVIEDDEDLSFAMGIALKSGGFNPVSFTDCDEASASLASADYRPHAILMDIHLTGEMSPAEFIAWLRAHGFADVPVLLVSGSPDIANVAKQIGANGYLRKPFEVAELVQRVLTAGKPIGK
jgi:DNA-binding response OmpR family regulator